MQRALLLGLLLGASLAGCVDPDPLRRATTAEPSGWEIDVDPAMAPDLSGVGETYPLLLIHEHHVWSERQIEQRRNVVCATTDGRPLPLLPPARLDAMAKAPCIGPPADPPTGRVFLDPAEYRARAPRALAILLDPCSGGIVFLDAREPRFLVRAPGHDFTIESLPDGTFRVDGQAIEPGTALKIGYFLHQGSARDEEYHRYVFEAPGRWPTARIGPAVGPIGPQRPDRGDGLRISVPLAPDTLAPVINAALAATPGGVLGIAGLRAVHDGARLTDLTLHVHGRDHDTTWYSAGRNGDALHLFAALAPGADAPIVDPAMLTPALALDWTTLRQSADPATLDARLDPTTRWTTLGHITLALPDATPVPCEDGCVQIHRAGAWQRALAAQEAPAEGATTLRATTYAGADEIARWWQVE